MTTRATTERWPARGERRHCRADERTRRPGQQDERAEGHQVTTVAIVKGPAGPDRLAHLRDGSRPPSRAFAAAAGRADVPHGVVDDQAGDRRQPDEGHRGQRVAAQGEHPEPPRSPTCSTDATRSTPPATTTPARRAPARGAASPISAASPSEVQRRVQVAAPAGRPTVSTVMPEGPARMAVERVLDALGDLAVLASGNFSTTSIRPGRRRRRRRRSAAGGPRRPSATSPSVSGAGPARPRSRPRPGPRPW